MAGGASWLRRLSPWGRASRLRIDPRCGLLLQWHVTERCNLRCAHCYQEDAPTGSLCFDEQLGVLDQYAVLLDRLAAGSRVGRAWGHVTLTGGEPFLHPRFFDLLDAVAARRDRWRFAILTNGTLLDDDACRRLRRLRPSFVQVSLEGTRSTHDRIRGAGSFERTVAAVRRLVGAKVPTYVSFTAHRGNVGEFVDVALLSARLGVTRVWADRMIPCGRGAALREALLTPAETRAFFESMEAARDRLRRDGVAGTEVAMHRALQFLVGGGHAYRCAAGRTLLALLPNGDVLPCRRLPLVVGNLRDRALDDLYFESPRLRALREPGRVAKGCEECVYRSVCGGGLRCLSQAVHGDPFHADPGCWRACGGRVGGLREEEVVGGTVA